LPEKSQHRAAASLKHLWEMRLRRRELVARRKVSFPPDGTVASS